MANSEAVTFPVSRSNVNVRVIASLAVGSLSHRVSKRLSGQRLRVVLDDALVDMACLESRERNHGLDWQQQL